MAYIVPPQTWLCDGAESGGVVYILLLLFVCVFPCDV